MFGDTYLSFIFLGKEIPSICASKYDCHVKYSTQKMETATLMVKVTCNTFN